MFTSFGPPARPKPFSVTDCRELSGATESQTSAIPRGAEHLWAMGPAGSPAALPGAEVTAHRRALPARSPGSRAPAAVALWRTPLPAPQSLLDLRWLRPSWNSSSFPPPSLLSLRFPLLGTTLPSAAWLVPAPLQCECRLLRGPFSSFVATLKSSCLMTCVRLFLPLRRLSAARSEAQPLFAVSGPACSRQGASLNSDRLRRPLGPGVCFLVCLHRAPGGEGRALTRARATPVWRLRAQPRT